MFSWYLHSVPMSSSVTLPNLRKMWFGPYKVYLEKLANDLMCQLQLAGLFDLSIPRIEVQLSCLELYTDQSASLTEESSLCKGKHNRYAVPPSLTGHGTGFDGPVASRQDIIINNYVCNITPYSQYIYTVVKTNYLKGISIRYFIFLTIKKTTNTLRQEETWMVNTNVVDDFFFAQGWQFVIYLFT